MSLLAFPVLGSSFLLSSLLACLVLVVVFLILSEKTKQEERVFESTKDVKDGAQEPAGDKVEETGRVEEVKVKETCKVEEVKVKETCRVEEVKGESSACSSGAEEEGRSKARRRRRKHSCEGAGACSSKKTVLEVVLLVDAQVQETQVCGEEVSARLGSGGLKTSTRALDVADAPSYTSNGSSVLYIFLLGREDGCDELVHALRETGDEKTNFVFSVAAVGQHEALTEAMQRLSDVLEERGGTEWVPNTRLTRQTQLQDLPPSHNEPTTLPDTSSSSSTLQFISTSSYSSKVLEKINKISKKCCGTSCGTKKAVDIEDLAASLLPTVTPGNT